MLEVLTRNDHLNHDLQPMQHWQGLELQYQVLAKVIALDQHGIALSSGSACKSGSPDPTHVLLAMGKTAEEAHCSIRFSLSVDTTEDEIDETLISFKEVLDEMENTVRFLPCK